MYLIGRGRYVKEGYPVSKAVTSVPDSNYVALPSAGINFQTQTNAGTDIPLAAVALQMKTSGVVEVDLTALMGDNTAAKKVVHNLFLFSWNNPANPVFAPAGTGLISTASLNISKSMFEQSPNPLTWGAFLNNNSLGLLANSFTFNGQLANGTGADFSFEIGSSQLQTIAGQVGADSSEQLVFPVSGIFGNNTIPIPNSQFAIGSWVVAAFTLTSQAGGGDIISYGNVNLSMKELPVA